MEELKIVINESDDCGVERIMLTDKPMCGVMGITFSDTVVTSEIKDGVKVVSYDLSTEIKPLK